MMTRFVTVLTSFRGRFGTFRDVSRRVYPDFIEIRPKQSGLGSMSTGVVAGSLDPALLVSGGGRRAG